MSETNKIISVIALSLLVLVGGSMLIGKHTRRSDEFWIERAKLLAVQQKQVQDSCVSVGALYQSESSESMGYCVRNRGEVK